MKKIKTIILSILVGLIAVNINVYAQKNTPEKMEIGVSVATGMSALNFVLVDGEKPSYGIGINFGWEAAFVFSEQLSFRTGVNLASFKSSVNIEQHNVCHQLIPVPAGFPDDHKFSMIAEFGNYKEQFEAFYIRLPLMLQYLMGAKNNFYVSAGANVGIPLNSVSQINSEKLITKGYSDFTMQEYENMPNHGFYTYSDIRTGSKLQLGLSLSAALETGMKWKIRNGICLYTGLFADFGLNNIRKGDSMKESVIFNEESESFIFNSVLHSQTKDKPLIDKVKPMFFGLRLKIVFQDVLRNGK